ncbi:hypothetical protein SAMN02745866_00894 [Alteromonadaceae bacterium Bs31]|nr:hypothetical protein SAMN02745866_00894 [Alteromonadaceae bacterium Bs31]
MVNKVMRGNKPCLDAIWEVKGSPTQIVLKENLLGRGLMGRGLMGRGLMGRGLMRAWM